MELTGSVCVVTGATEGIGRAIAESLGARGAKVAICARTGDRVSQAVSELKRGGGVAVGAACDVADEAGVTRFAQLVSKELGPAQVLVNNAGLAHFAPVGELTVEQFDQVMAVNVRGIFLMTRAFLPAMLERRSGHIVNIASLAGRNGFVGGTAYTASKHAVLGFSKSLMLEVRQHNVRVIAVCPGSVVTPFFDKVGSRLHNADRVLQPQDVAHAVVAALEVADRAMVSELDIRPTNP